MAQLYNPLITRFLRSLLLQCVFLLGIAAVGVAQSTATYNGPWSSPAEPGLTTNRLSIDGPNLDPSEAGGSAQLRVPNESYVDIQLPAVAGGDQSTPYRVSYSLSASTTRTPFTAQISVRYSTTGSNPEAYTEQVKLVSAPRREVLRDTVELPGNATNVRFILAAAQDAYVLLDAIEVTQEPVFTSFAPAEGVAGASVIITGERLHEVSAVRFGDVAATTFNSNENGTEVEVTVPTGVQTSAITVVTPYGQATSAMQFTVPAPIVEGFTPQGGAGDVITITGRYFTDATSVEFNGVAAEVSTITVVDDNTITVEVPAGASDGTITVAGVERSGSSTTSFDVLAPTIAGFEPVTGGSVGTPVTISGQYLAAVTGVLFNGVAATFELNEEGDIETTVPMGAATGLITLQSPEGDVESSEIFDVPAPTISGFEPTSAGPNMQITLTGANLSGVEQVVFLGGADNAEDDRTGTIVTPVTSDTELVVTVPADASTGLIQVIAPGDNKTATSEQVFTYVPAPTIATVETIKDDASYGYGIVGDIVTVTGENFETATDVVLGGVAIEPYDAENNTDGFRIVSGDTITFNIIDGLASGSVSVTTLGGTAAWEGPFDVVYAPAISSIAPTEGPIGQEVTITGSYLKYASVVTFAGAEGSIEVTEFVSQTDSEIKVLVPAGAITGTLSVTNPAGTTESEQEYEVIVTPVIHAFTPDMGVGGDLVTITGYNFTGTTAVTFGESAAIEAYNAETNPGGFTVVSDTELTVYVPADATTGLITITNAEGPGSSEDQFSIIALPVIASINPDKGIAGSEVTITGSWFIGECIAVTFLGENGQKDDGDIAVSDGLTINEEGTEIKVTVPEGAATGPLMVTNAAGNSNASAVYTVVTTPEITAFTPTEGVVGEEVKIEGWLLNQVTGVNFNGAVQAVPTYNAADSTVTVAVPEGATTGPLSLVVSEEVVYTTPADQIFTVIPAPTIATVDPMRGIAGTEVTITGTNFIDVTEVTFNGVKAETFSVNETFDELTVTVPYAATTGRIEVVAEAGKAESTEDFVVPVPANITFSPTTSYAGQEVVITGQYFTNATEVAFNGRKIANVTVVDAEEGESQNPDRLQQIVIKAPFDAGTGAITVTTPAGPGTSQATYTVIEPSIATITAEDGAAKGYAGRTIATITGNNFTTYWNETTGAEDNKAPVVIFTGANGQPILATEIQSYSNTEIVVVVPNNARTGGVSVRSGSGESVPVNFEILAPTISSVNPTAVYAGEWVEVTGTNFIDVTSVNYGGIEIPIANTEIDSENLLAFIAPVVGVNTSNSLTITTKSGSVVSEALTVYKPVIETVANTRVYAGVDNVTITGTRFDEYYHQTRSGGEVRRAAPTVSFAGGNGRIEVTAFESFTPSTTEGGTDRIVVKVPAGAITGTIQVASNSGTGASESITIIGAPTITGFSVNSGLIGTTFTINGTNFDQATKVEFTGVTESADFEVVSDTEISVTVPEGAVTGPVTVTTPYGGGAGTAVTSTQDFRVVYAPVIAGLTPESGPAGRTVRITGSNLWALYEEGTTQGGAIKVFFSGHNGSDIPTATPVPLSATVTDYDDVAGTWIEVTVPANAITGIITVTNEAGTATTDAMFEVTSPQIVRFEREGDGEITSVNPARILETILIKGYSLSDVGTIRFTGAASALNFWEIDQYTVEVEVPRGARTGSVEITTLGGTTTSSAVLYIAAPTINVDPGSLSFSVEAGQVSEVKSYTVSASNLPIGEDLEIGLFGRDNAVNDFYIAVGDDESERTWVKVLPALSADETGAVQATIHVRSQPAEDAETDQGGIITNRSYGYSTPVTLSTTVLPLPVELMTFNAAVQNNNVLLTWATASEQNNSHFEVEMSGDAKNGFERIGRVDSKGSNSSIRLDYEFTHKLGNLAGTIYYRLKQVDVDGTTDYSKVVAVNVKARELVQQLLVAPNPINYNSKLFVTAAVSGKASLALYSMTGKKVYSKVVELQEGPNEVQLPVYEKLSKGMYVLKVELNGQVSQIKVMKE